MFSLTGPLLTVIGFTGLAKRSLKMETKSRYEVFSATPSKRHTRSLVPVPLVNRRRQRVWRCALIFSNNNAGPNWLEISLVIAPISSFQSTSAVMRFKSFLSSRLSIQSRRSLAGIHQLQSVVRIILKRAHRTRRRNLISLSFLLTGQRQQGAAHKSFAQLDLVTVHFERLRRLERRLRGFGCRCVTD